MMRGAGGALAVTIAALLVCCSADQDTENGNEPAGERYNAGEPKLKEQYQDYLRFLLTYLNGLEERNVNQLSGRNIFERNNYNDFVGKNLGAGSFANTYQGKHTLGKAVDRNWNTHVATRFAVPSSGLDTGGDSYSGYVDSLGGGNFVRNLDSMGEGSFARHLDTIGGGILVKKNLDHIGGPHLVKRILDSIGGGNLVRRSDGHKTEGLAHPGVGFARQAREAGQYRFVPYLMTRRFDYVSPYGSRRWAPGYGYYGDGLPKRNFDEIDRSDLDTFVRKRNFDEIDQTAMPFPSSKRGLGLNAFAHKRNFDEIDQTLMPLPYSKRATMFRPMGGMDEIDLSEIPFSSKRSMDILRSQH